MSRWTHLLAAVVLLGCSGLEEGTGGVVALEIETPSLTSLEVGETAQLAATALDADGNVVDVTLAWRAADNTVTVSETGLVTAVAPGTGRVQALAGSLSSALVTFTVIARADTLIIVGDSILTVPVEPGTTADLVVQLASFSPPGPLDARPVIYQITSPPPGTAPVVALTGGVQADTVTTGADGTVVGVRLARVTGTTAPASAIVTVRALRTRGAEVPGSGQRFVIGFE